MYNGTGIYSLPEASRLIHVPAQKIHRWLYGHKHSKKSGEERVQTVSEPLWTPQHSKAEFEIETIGFNDLLEIRFVAAFVRYGVPLTVVRRCLETAQDLYGMDYPMSSGAFKTDGKTIFAEAIEKTAKEGALLDLRNRQFAFNAIISPSLYAGIEYDGRRATKWYPQGRRHHVVLDPSRQFGSPIVDEVGVPTGVLFASYKAEGASADAIAQTARAYDVPVKFVDAAIKFEQDLARTVH
ncbi:DUF433 domain-containing protein [Rhodoferax sp. 4810]|nr:DUF433 domain-containing protein [Rhodoferax jenense]